MRGPTAEQPVVGGHGRGQPEARWTFPADLTPTSWPWPQHSEDACPGPSAAAVGATLLERRCLRTPGLAQEHTRVLIWAENDRDPTALRACFLQQTHTPSALSKQAWHKEQREAWARLGQAPGCSGKCPDVLSWCRYQPLPSSWRSLWVTEATSLLPAPPASRLGRLAAVVANERSCAWGKFFHL